MARGGGGGLGCVIVFISGLMLWSWIDGWSDGARDVPDPQPTPAPSISLIDWQFQGSTRADGWPSGSIGKQGACSHHGGVVGVWVSKNGVSVTCRGTPPLTEERLAELTNASGEVVC